MKRFLACLLVLVMALSLTACMGNGNLEGEATENGGTDEKPGGLENGANDQKQSLASRLVDDFKNLLDGDNMLGGAALADELLKGDYMDFETKKETVQPGKLDGFKKEIQGFKEGVKITSTDGKRPFMAYLFTLDEKTDSAQFVSMLKESADAQWNGGIEAEEMMAESLGDKVLFVMSPEK